MRAAVVMVMLGVVVPVGQVGAEMEGRWRVVKERRVASMPWSVVVSADGERVYVAHVGVGKRDRDNVWRLEGDQLEVKARSVFDGHGVEMAKTASSAPPGGRG